MSVRLTLLSHASTEAVRRAAFPLDEPLDPPGRAAAVALAPGLARFDIAWTGPELRARETLGCLGLDAVIEPVLRDIDLGRWAGRRFADIELTEPDALAAWTGDWTAAPHGGESISDVIRRVSPWLDAVGSSAGRILAVTHPAIIRAVVLVAIDAPPRSFWRIEIAPLGRVHLRGHQRRWSLRSITADPRHRTG